MISLVFKRIWNSPSLMTWGSFSGRVFVLLLVWPVITTKLPTEEVALWLLFSTFGMLILMLDLGFTPTLSRLFSYAMGGVRASELQQPEKLDLGKSPNKAPNWELLEEVFNSTRTIFLRISIFGLIILSTVGTIAIYKPAMATSDITTSWLSWGIVVAYLTISLAGRTYVAYLEGTNHIALVRRWDALFSYLNILATLSVLFLGGELLSVTLVSFVATVASIVRNRKLSQSILEGRMLGFSSLTISSTVWNAAWPNAWRSAIGIAMSRGIIDLSGIVYAQVASASDLAEYLLALRFIQTLSLFSRVPFYTRLPELAKLRAQGRYSEQSDIAARTMLFSHILFVIGFIFLALVGPWFFTAIDSNINFPDHTLWLLLGYAMLAERFGAMHMQLYTTTNHVLWHKINGISGVLCIIAAVSLFPFMGTLAFPSALIVGYAGYYAWYSAYLSYKAFPITFPNFEIKASLAPVAAFILFSAAQYINPIQL